MKKRFYIAYGSNLNLRQMQMRCPTATVVGTSVIDGYELLFKGSLTGSYLTIEKRDGGKVPVAIWQVTEEDEASLDRYEGYPTFYYKADMILPVKDIQSKKVEQKKCFVYIMHENRKIGMPRPFYIDTCLEGYTAFGFDRKYIDEAIKISKGAVRDEKFRFIWH